MKKVFLFLALIVGLLVSATLQAQNMSRYNTLRNYPYNSSTDRMR